MAITGGQDVTDDDTAAAGPAADSPQRAVSAERDELDRLLAGITSENADDAMVDDVVGNECW